jgi:hypothetical protein
MLLRNILQDTGSAAYFFVFEGPLSHKNLTTQVSIVSTSKIRISIILVLVITGTETYSGELSSNSIYLYKVSLKSINQFKHIRRTGTVLADRHHKARGSYFFLKYGKYAKTIIQRGPKNVLTL